MTAEGETSWYEFTKAIVQQVSPETEHLSWVNAATKGMPLLAKQVLPITAAEYPTTARRPAYSVLSTRRLHDRFGVRLSPWRAQLRSLFTQDSSEDRHNF
jgi:dTDP-4-dehydrorhamnose reductase